MYVFTHIHLKKNCCVDFRLSTVISIQNNKWATQSKNESMKICNGMKNFKNESST